MKAWRSDRENELNKFSSDHLSLLFLLLLLSVLFVLFYWSELLHNIITTQELLSDFVHKYSLNLTKIELTRDRR